jgi:hypothetical protein
MLSATSAAIPIAAAIGTNAIIRSPCAINPNAGFIIGLVIIDIITLIAASNAGGKDKDRCNT